MQHHNPWATTVGVLLARTAVSALIWVCICQAHHVWQNTLVGTDDAGCCAMQNWKRSRKACSKNTALASSLCQELNEQSGWHASNMKQSQACVRATVRTPVLVNQCMQLLCLTENFSIVLRIIHYALFYCTCVCTKQGKKCSTRTLCNTGWKPHHESILAAYHPIHKWGESSITNGIT